MQRISLTATLVAGALIASMHVREARAIGPIRLESFDDDFWASTTIVVARVTEYTAPIDATKPSYIHLEPIATLCGNLDPARTQSVVAELWCGPFYLVPRKPTVGKNVLVLLRHRTSGRDQLDMQYWVEEGVCKFMPNGLSLVEINDLDDQRIGEVTSAVRKLREESKRHRARNVAKP